MERDGKLGIERGMTCNKGLTGTKPVHPGGLHCNHLVNEIKPAQLSKRKKKATDGINTMKKMNRYVWFVL